jgi:hypothetical protein
MGAVVVVIPSTIDYQVQIRSPYPEVLQLAEEHASNISHETKIVKGDSWLLIEISSPLLSTIIQENPKLGDLIAESKQQPQVWTFVRQCEQS